ncbi:MAG TPA: response regulator transcription factor [Pyrinomonadaceae bacterium]|jgi:DNA-binding response OmpR family regulator|nr:response regulator transcription factor [Pyrinomonadaceae bacterium]
MKRLLLVEDDRSLGATLHERLLREKYDVAWVETKQRALKKLEEGNWDLVILDIGLPDGSGFELGRHIKENTKLPIMFMTALSTAEHRLEGFEIGAEEFIPKPFHLRELLLRVEHVLERHPVRHQASCNGRSIDLEARAIVQPDGQREIPPARDFELLRLLISSSPAVVSRNQILDELWGEDKLLNQRTIDNMVVRLRQMLGDAESTCIRSVRGVGYQWCGDE